MKGQGIDSLTIELTTQNWYTEQDANLLVTHLSGGRVVHFRDSAELVERPSVLGAPDRSCCLLAEGYLQNLMSETSTYTVPSQRQMVGMVGFVACFREAVPTTFRFQSGNSKPS